jgi:hypothetical protein
LLAVSLHGKDEQAGKQRAKAAAKTMIEEAKT